MIFIWEKDFKKQKIRLEIQQQQDLKEPKSKNNDIFVHIFFIDPF